MAYLNNIELTERGDRRSVVAYDKDKKAKLLAFVWVDRERRYFIASTSSMQEGRPWVRKRLRQIVDDDVTDPETVELVVPQPQVAELYYKCCGMIDQHNRDRQDTLCLEHKVLTKDWSMRVNLSIVAMIMVDCWRVWRLITLSASGDDCIENQKQFYSRLASELIDNCYDRRSGIDREARQQQHQSALNELIDAHTMQPRAGTGIHITPTKRKRRNKEGEYTSNTFQGRCLVCSEKTIYQCSKCVDDALAVDKERVAYVCFTNTGKMCFMNHVCEHHAE